MRRAGLPNPHCGPKRARLVTRVTRRAWPAFDATKSGVTGRRPTCLICLRAHCVCACLRRPGVPAPTPVALLVLQHPGELRHTKGTARLLHLAVAGSRLLVGPAWPEWVPDAETRTDGTIRTTPATSRRDLLLYPATPGDSALPAPPPLDPAWLADPGRLRLVVIDGTWRKARRMLCDSPWLQSLPRWSLQGVAPGRYRIRRARGAGQLSTFEAAVHALHQLAPAADGLAALWPVFDDFVEQQAQRRVQRPPADPSAL